MEKQKPCKKCKGRMVYQHQAGACPPRYICLSCGLSDFDFRSRRFVNWDALPGRG